jgi:hypothetical protein
LGRLKILETIARRLKRLGKPTATGGCIPHRLGQPISAFHQDANSKVPVGHQRFPRFPVFSGGRERFSAIERQPINSETDMLSMAGGDQ